MTLIAQLYAPKRGVKNDAKFYSRTLYIFACSRADCHQFTNSDSTKAESSVTESKEDIVDSDEESENSLQSHSEAATQQEQYLPPPVTSDPHILIQIARSLKSMSSVEVSPKAWCVLRMCTDIEDATAEALFGTSSTSSSASSSLSTRNLSLDSDDEEDYDEQSLSNDTPKVTLRDSTTTPTKNNTFNKKSAVKQTASQIIKSKGGWSDDEIEDVEELDSMLEDLLKDHEQAAVQTSLVNTKSPQNHKSKSKNPSSNSSTSSVVPSNSPQP
jgi:hypothetical protein